MIQKLVAKPLFAAVSLLFVVATVVGPLAPGVASAASDTVDEIHYSYGDTSDSVVFDWHGQEQNIYYGLDSTYGQQAVAGNPAAAPVDMAGPFREVKLNGLLPGLVYHYRIGLDGLDHTFTTVPTGDFTWVDMGDTASTYCDSWLAQTHSLAAAQNPNFVTHGGDISYANECGVPSVHQYYVDQEAWSHGAAFQPVWGNHEYGKPSTTAPAGTPRDSMLNYKERSYVTNAQTVPNDTTSQINNPGCGWETGSTTNTCVGEDWGWFEAGHVMYISFPEPWVNAQTDWGTRAATLMANAQADPNIDFIVTYGHRPAYSSLSSADDTTMQTVLAQLANSYSPNANNPNGKYILNIAHHVHGEEVFSPMNGLVNITDGGGGAGQTTYDATPAAGSIYRTVHPGILSARYSAAQHTLSVNLLCGPDYQPKIKEHCTYGSTLYSQTFQSNNVTVSPTSKLATTLTDNASGPQVGDQITYTVGASNQTQNTTAAGVTATVTLPANETIVDPGTGVVSGNTVSWSMGDLTGGQAATTAQVVAQVVSGAAGDSFTATANVTSTDGSCQNTGSVCSSTDTDTIPTPPPTFVEWITNPGVETDLTGWSGKYGTASYSSVTRDTSVAHGGIASVKVTALTGASNSSLGFNDNPRWITSTTAGQTYTQSAWVKPTYAGQVLNMRLREWKGSTLVTDKLVSMTATTTDWQQLGQTLTAAGSGNQLSFAVYCSKFNAGQSFYADDFSLTTPN